MLQIKIISYPSAMDVEESFKTWISKTKCTIKDIKYSTVVEENEEVRHSVLIMYTQHDEPLNC